MFGVDFELDHITLGDQENKSRGVWTPNFGVLNRK